MRKIYTLVLVALLALTDLQAAPKYHFRRYSSAEGLSSVGVIDILQDKDGLIWMGTIDGLNIFDGRNFHVLDLPEPGLSTAVDRLFQDSEGTIWVGTDDAVYYGNLSGMTRLTSETSDYPKSSVTSFCEDRDGSIWFTTREQGVFNYKKDTGKLTSYLGDDENYKNTELVFIDPNNVVCVCPTYTDNMIMSLNRNAGTFSPIPLNYNGVSPSRACAASLAPNGKIILGTWNQGLYYYDPQSKEVSSCLDGRNRAGFNHIHNITEIEPWVYLVGSDDGLLWSNLLTGESKLFINDLNDKTSLSNKFVYPIVVDNEGGIWVGTYYGGVNYVAANSGQFQSLSMSSLTGNPEESIVSCFAEGSDGTIWVGSDNGGLMQYDPSSDKALRTWSPNRGNKLSSYNLHSLFIDGDYIWVGTYAGGVNRINMKTGQTKVYYTKDGLDNSSIYSVFKDKDGTLWVGTMFGINTYDYDQDKFENKYTLESTVQDIDQTQDGLIWFATTTKGLISFNPADGKWTTYTMSNSDLPSNTIYTLFNDGEGRLYIGTGKGLCEYTPESKSIVRINLGEDVNVFFGAEYGSQLWLATNKGLLRYSSQDGAKEYYGINDGVMEGQFLTNSGLLTSDGRIFLGSSNGMVSFYPHKILINKIPPTVLISGFQTRNIDKTGEIDYISQPLENGNKLTHKQRNIRFGISALSYCAPEKNGFSCYLEGFDSQWRDLGNQNTVEYTNLPPGRYVFMANATNNDGIPSESPATIEFVIKPPIWASKGAMALYGLLLIGLLYFLYKAVTKRSEARYQVKYDDLVRQRKEEELNAKVNFVTSIAHEVRTPLSLITAPIERMMSHEQECPQSLRSDLNVIDRNSKRLMSLVSQILDFSKINSETLSVMQPAYKNIPDVVKQVVDIFMPTIENMKIKFSYDCPDTDFHGDVDAEVLNKIVSNLLSNAVKYTKDEISMSLTHTDDTYTLKVKDNGKGISKELQKRVFAPFYRIDESKQGTGLGLAIVRQLTAASDGTITLESEPDKGSEFTLTMPLTKLTENMEEEVQTEIPAGETQETPLKTGKRPVMLVVEDDADLLEFLVDDFHSTFDTMKATDGKAAVEILKNKVPDIIISDWMMPAMSGAELCKYVRANKNLRHIPFIMLTAKADDNSELVSLNCGADAHVKKPFSLEHLHALVNHLVSMREVMARKYSGLTDAEARQEDYASSTDVFIKKLNEIIEANIANTEFLWACWRRSFAFRVPVFLLR